ncbi:MAG: nitrous oxide reductase accessory protein NosL [Saprospiraceae bacterium]|jgi:copper chaperone NosL|nr:nitrous oxide reductase accessory protein NosL [Saprospiraceae bacterium]MBP9209544.1 nitrous oxide reductase accessory protein NosL [Saprospiraceae bacterium]MBV6472617.1 hypothetical protein [Saprospiraceae bacterium]
MGKTKLSQTSRWIVFFASLLLIVTFFVPVWRIDLFAPQYPEGLTMNIWLYTITGDVEIINGLNHYIGMKEITVDMFPEFAFLVYIVGFYILLGLLVAWFGRLAILFWYLVFTAFGGVFSMFDFYRWAYEYGHNLDPTAAIKVPGLSYQPPLIGHKRLLNFDAYSQPDVGGWIVLIAAAVMAFVWIYEWNRHRPRKSNAAPLAALAALFVITASCKAKPEPFIPGTDVCHMCKMGIVDLRFGAELVTEKGKVYKFDDVGCMVRMMKSGEFDNRKMAHVLVADFSQQNVLIDVGKAHFVVGQDVRSPMNFNTAAFSTQAIAQDFSAQGNGRQIVGWDYVYQNID